ncbi:MAG: 5'-nucleotidase C-terminal domain-containing protein [Treponema sp.]|nr:5'-nucleotidase C-terminal domain-containing protein [Treponema sp.]
MKRTVQKMALALLCTSLVSFAFAGGKKDKAAKKVVNSFSYEKSGIVTKGKAGSGDTAVISIAATSDMHGRIYPWEYAIDAPDNDAGFALTDTVVQKIKSEYPDTLLIDIGDSMQDNSAELFVDMDTHPMIQALNFLGYDVWVPGNHEFNFGLDFLQRNFKNFEGRVVCSNISYADSGKPYILPYQIFDIDGVKVAVIGSTAPHVSTWEASAPEHFQNLDFTDPIESMKKTVKEIEGQYDILVAAVHISRQGEYDQEGKTGAFQIAQAIPELDVIIAGHEHALYCEKVNDTWVLEPGKYGSHVAFTKFNLKKENGAWKITDISAENIPTKNLASSQAVLDKFKWVDDKAKENANSVVGKVAANFIPEGTDFITGADNVTTMPRAQVEDTALMDLINEVQMYYAKAEISTAALFNFDQTLKAGDFKRKDVAFIYKYDNTLMGTNITGKNLLAYMEWTVGYFQTSQEGDVTITFNHDFRAYNYDMLAGIDYEIDLSKPSGSRIVNAKIKGKPVDPNATYKLAVNNYRFGTLLSNHWVTMNDIYFDSYNEMPLTATCRDLIVKYTQENLKGELKPRCDHNWKIVGLPSTYNDPATIAKIKSGEITIPSSSDGRTPNVKPVRVTK